MANDLKKSSADGDLDTHETKDFQDILNDLQVPTKPEVKETSASAKEDADTGLQINRKSGHPGGDPRSSRINDPEYSSNITPFMPNNLQKLSFMDKIGDDYATLGFVVFSSILIFGMCIVFFLYNPYRRSSEPLNDYEIETDAELSFTSDESNESPQSIDSSIPTSIVLIQSPSVISIQQSTDSSPRGILRKSSFQNLASPMQKVKSTVMDRSNCKSLMRNDGDDPSTAVFTKSSNSDNLLIRNMTKDTATWEGGNATNEFKRSSRSMNDRISDTTVFHKKDRSKSFWDQVCDDFNENVIDKRKSQGGTG